MTLCAGETLEVITSNLKRWLRTHIDRCTVQYHVRTNLNDDIFQIITFLFYLKKKIKINEQYLHPFMTFFDRAGTCSALLRPVRRGVGPVGIQIDLSPP